MLRVGQGVNLDARTRMMYDDRHVFLNGESFRASGPDARWMRQLADHRALGPREVAALSAQARELVEDAVQAGWMHAHPPLRGAP
jgi:50S ribosomal protein L16 3-hydroxylase